MGPQEETRGARRCIEEVSGQVMQPSRHVNNSLRKNQKGQVCQSAERYIPELPVEGLPVESGPREGASKHGQVKKVPATPVEVVQPPPAGESRSEAPVERSELGPASTRPRRTTRTPKHLEDFELFGVDAGANSNGGTPEYEPAHMSGNQFDRMPEEEKWTNSGSQSTDLPVYKKSYRDALIGVKTIGFGQKDIDSAIKSSCKKHWPVGQINGAEVKERAKKPWQPRAPKQPGEFRQLGTTWQPKRLSQSREAGRMQWSKKSWQTGRLRSRQSNESWQLDRPVQAKKCSQTEARYSRMMDSIANRVSSRGGVERQAQTVMAERKAKILKRGKDNR